VPIVGIRRKCSFKSERLENGEYENVPIVGIRRKCSFKSINEIPVSAPSKSNKPVQHRTPQTSKNHQISSTTFYRARQQAMRADAMFLWQIRLSDRRRYRVSTNAHIVAIFDE